MVYDLCAWFAISTIHFHTIAFHTISFHTFILYYDHHLCDGFTCQRTTRIVVSFDKSFDIQYVIGFV